MHDLQALRAATAALGADFNLVQAQGGNTSIKQDDTLWVKASGTRLSDALASDIFVPVSLELGRRALERSDEAAIKQAKMAHGGAGMLPSIETALHLALPHRAVFHGHPVATLALMVRAEAPHDELTRRLAGLAWRFVPYVRPGMPLARAVQAAGAGDVYLLQNHGLIVGAASPEEALTLYRHVEARLEAGWEVAAEDAPARTEAAGGALMTSAALTRFTNDEAALQRWRDVTPYPDHVVFLGHGAQVADTVAAATQGAWALVRGQGAWVAANLTSSAVDMIEAMARIDARIPRGQSLRSLSAPDCREILGYDMEDHRMKLAREIDQRKAAP